MSAEMSQVLGELEVKYAQSKAELQSVQSQIVTRQKDIKVMEVTEQQLRQQVPDEGARVWQGIGKMFLGTDVKSYLGELGQNKKDAQEQVDLLKKKEAYLEKTYQNLTSALMEIVSKTEQTKI